MIEGLIGAAPASWDVVPLGTVCGLQAGLSKRVGRSAADGVPLVMIGNIERGRIVPDDLRRIVLPGRSWHDRYSLRPDDVVCARTGDLGRSALATGENAGWLVGSGCMRLRAGPLVKPRYLLHYLEHPEVKEWFRRSSTGSVIPNLNADTLADMPLLVPPIDTQELMTDILGTLDEKIAVHEEIARTTSDLRGSILRLLLSGERPPFPAPPS